MYSRRRRYPQYYPYDYRYYPRRYRDYIYNSQIANNSQNLYNSGYMSNVNQSNYTNQILNRNSYTRY